MYYTFDSVEQLFTAINSGKPEIHEMVPDTWQKFRIDIDGTEDKLSNKATLIDEAVGCVNALFQNMFGIALTEEQIIVLDSSNDHKFSAHIIVDGYCFANARQTKKVFATFREYFSDEKVLDFGVYKPNQSFRVEGCTKQGQNRTLVRTDGKFSVDTLKASLLSYCCDCKQLSVSEEEEPKREKIVSSSNLYEIFQSWSEDAPFEPRNQDGGDVLYLDRIEPSYCICCEREHESDNAMVRSDAEGRVFFKCFRADYSVEIGILEKPPISYRELKYLR